MDKIHTKIDLCYESIFAPMPIFHKCILYLILKYSKMSRE